MVKFLAVNTGMDISLLTFHGFAYDGKTLLARQVEVEAAADPGPRRRYAEHGGEKRAAEEKTEDSGMSETFSAVEGMFEANWPRFSTYAGAWGLSIKFQTAYARDHGGKRQYSLLPARQSTVPGRVSMRGEAGPDPDTEIQLRVHRRRVQEPGMSAVRYETWPRNREPAPDTARFTAEEWQQHKERLSALTTAVYEAWKNSGQ